MESWRLRRHMMRMPCSLAGALGDTPILSMTLPVAWPGLSRRTAALLYGIGVSTPGLVLLSNLHFGWPGPWSRIMLLGPLVSAVATLQSSASRRQRVVWLLVIPVAVCALFFLAFLIAGFNGPRGHIVLD